MVTTSTAVDVCIYMYVTISIVTVDHKLFSGLLTAIDILEEWLIIFKLISIFLHENIPRAEVRKNLLLKRIN